MAQFDMFDQVTLCKQTRFEPRQGLFNRPQPRSAFPHTGGSARHVPQFHTTLIYYA